MQTQLNKLLQLDFHDEGIWLTSTYTLRKLIGILGMALPLLLFIFLYIDTGHSSTLESISHYYYTRANTIFIIILSLMAIFLMVYKGKEPVDFYLSFIAGLFALMVILFPTDNITEVCCDTAKPYSVTVLTDNDFRTGFHYISAAIFLICLTYMSLFLFTKSDKVKEERTKQKKQRNRIYITCGILMALALIVIFLGFLKIIPEDIYAKNHLTFWMETVAVGSFGFSWLVKGEAMLKDKNALD
ncbi:MAG: hypothetical protein QNJ57_05635 [Flavobacteriaceae bacterium]|nr:hypothetical protein [Flavobacteriaceae bacterium]